MLPFAAVASLVDATWYTTSAWDLVISLVTAGHTTLVPVVGDGAGVAVMLGIAVMLGVAVADGPALADVVGIGVAAGSGASAALAVVAITPVVVRAIAPAAITAMNFAWRALLVARCCFT